MRSPFALQRLARWVRFNLMYLGRPRWDTGVSPPELLEFIRQNPPGRAIDLGCGTGTNLLTLAKAGWQVTGVDFALRAVREARRKLRLANVPGEVRMGDVARLDLVRGEYDFVLDIGCYHGLGQAARAAYQHNLREILAPGGAYLLYAHWMKPGQADGIGINRDDFDLLKERLRLEERQDSQDQWGRTATWLRFRHPIG